MLTIENSLPVELIKRVAAKIEAELGLSFGSGKEHDLRQAIHRMAASLSAENDAACARWLLAAPWTKSKADLCALHLTIGETYFFREARAFDLVCDYAKEKIRKDGTAGARLRIWSAGCCTGEEPYSIAIALKRHVPELKPEQLSIHGTDLNRRSLEIARAGVYSQWSFRSPDRALRNAYFADEGNGRFRLNQAIRESVKFSELNLAAPVYPPLTTDTQAVDIIFCRNVLMYFSTAQARMVIERFRQCLVDGGWIVVSPSEASAELFSGFSGTYYPDAIYFRKNPPEDFPTAGSGSASGKEEGDKIAGWQATGIPEDVDKSSIRLFSPVEAAAFGPIEKSASAKPDWNAREMGFAPCEEEQSLGSPSFFHAKALTAMESGDQHGAVKNLRHALYLQPDSIIAHYLMGIAQLRQGKQREARRQFEMTNRLLAAMADDEIVPESEGWSAAYLRESLRPFLAKGAE